MSVKAKSDQLLYRHYRDTACCMRALLVPPACCLVDVCVRRYHECIHFQHGRSQWESNSEPWKSIPMPCDHHTTLKLFQGRNATETNESDICFKKRTTTSSIRKPPTSGPRGGRLSPSPARGTVFTLNQFSDHHCWIISSNSSECDSSKVERGNRSPVSLRLRETICAEADPETPIGGDTETTWKRPMRSFTPVMREKKMII